jgi:aminomethyltransferase
MKRTPLFEKHAALGARMVDFSGWQMPIQYPDGIVAEHLATRKHAGLFDVSHMGRFQVKGDQAAAFLRYVLTNDCNRLEAGCAHYTALADQEGGAIDDAFLYRPSEDKYLLVVNASNKDKDLQYLQQQLKAFSDVVLDDVSEEVAMLALQGPRSESIMEQLVTAGTLPVPKRNAVSRFLCGGMEICAARTGYTGEPTCFELFVPAASANKVWDKLIAAGAVPVGLGARDTLRLEAGLPLYGHELGTGKDGNEIPLFAIPQARFAVSFDDEIRQFIGKESLWAQLAARDRYKGGDFSDTSVLSKIVRQIRLLEKGIARDGAVIYYQEKAVGWVSSGTMVPYWIVNDNRLTDEQSQRAVGLCLIQPHVPVGARVEVEVRGRKLKAKVVSKNLEKRKTNITYPII